MDERGVGGGVGGRGGVEENEESVKLFGEAPGFIFLFILHRLPKRSASAR